LLLENNTKVAVNMKWILICFEQLSSIQINFHPSGLLPIDMDVEELPPLIDIFQCVTRTSPIRYLGIRLHFYSLRLEDSLDNI
jgi:hypothetical protein